MWELGTIKMIAFLCFVLCVLSVCGIPLPMDIPNVDDSSLEFIDLTYPLDPNVPVYPVYPKFKIQSLFRGLKLGDVAFNANNISLAEHTGTHMDVPAHASNVGTTVDKYPINRFVNRPAVVINITAKTCSNPDSTVDMEDVEKWEQAHGKIPKRALVLMHSGWGVHFDNAADFLNEDENKTKHHPGFSANVTKWLIEERDIVGIGSDTISFDPGYLISTFPSHKLILVDNDLVGLENVANLDKMPPAGATVSMFPMNIRNGTGAPCRIIAWFKKNQTEIVISSTTTSV